MTSGNLYIQGVTQSHQERCKYNFNCLVFSEMCIFEYASQRQDTGTRQTYRRSGGSQGKQISNCWTQYYLRQGGLDASTDILDARLKSNWDLAL